MSLNCARCLPKRTLVSQNFGKIFICYGFTPALLHRWVRNGAWASCYRQHCLHRKAPVYISYSNGTDGGEIWHGGLDPHRCNDKGIGPQNWKYYWNLTKLGNINATQERIPCAIFTKFKEFLPRFRTRVEIWMDLLKELRSCGGLKLRGSGFPQIFSAQTGETMRRTLKSFRRARASSRPSITMPSLMELRLSFVCLSFCLFVTLLNVRDFAPDFALQTFPGQSRSPTDVSRTDVSQTIAFPDNPLSRTRRFPERRFPDKLY